MKNLQTILTTLALTTTSLLYAQAPSEPEPVIPMSTVSIVESDESIQKKFDNAVKNLEKDPVGSEGTLTAIANSNSPFALDATIKLGDIYRNGVGNAKKADTKKAVAYYKDAADAGSAYAMSSLATIYLRGEGNVDANVKVGLSWLEKAANAGDVTAMSNLGYVYQTGNFGLEKDMRKALNWNKRAAAKGDVDAMYSVYEIQFANENYKEAIKYLEMAAEKEMPKAMFELGKKRYQMAGGLAEKEEAVALIRKASEKGYDAATQWLKENNLMSSHSSETSVAPQGNASLNSSQIQGILNRKTNKQQNKRSANRTGRP